MMNDALAHGPLIAILAMAAATLTTRFAGYWLMGHIPMTRRVRRCLEILPGAIMAATVVPIVAKVGTAAGRRDRRGRQHDDPAQRVSGGRPRARGGVIRTRLRDVIFAAK